ncbi:MAG: hypothetical protein D3916_17275 [Candidatus Electrothrix sp. MAN1_4]|nr:hypothetical protein [Candidatus Electrothrix sp. MAN1_4]
MLGHNLSEEIRVQVRGQSQQQQGELFKGWLVVFKEGGEAGRFAGEIQRADFKGLGLTEMHTQATTDDGFQPVKGELEVGSVGSHCSVG